jgi:hypothetical protein
MQCYFAGPFQVVSITNNYVYKLQIGDKVKAVHCRRLHKFATKDMLMPASVIEISKKSLFMFEVSKVHRYKFDKSLDTQVALVSYLGMDEPIWVPRHFIEA